MGQRLEHYFIDVAFNQVKHFKTAKAGQHGEVFVDVNLNLVKVFLFVSVNLLCLCLFLALHLLHAVLDFDEVCHVFRDLSDEVKHLVDIVIRYIFLNVEVNAVHEVHNGVFQGVAEIS